MQRRLALSVGNNAYPREPLSYAVPDANALYDVLDKVDFPCIRCIDATRSKFQSCLSTFIEQITVSHSCIIFNFNGHCKVINGQATLIFTDGEEEVAGRDTVESVINRVMNEARWNRGATFLLLLNCCRVNSSCPAVQVNRWRFRSTRRARDTAMACIWACSPGQPARDGSPLSGCSAFMQAFVQCVGQPLTLSNVWDYIFAAVTSDDQMQRPLLWLNAAFRDYQSFSLKRSHREVVLSSAPERLQREVDQKIDCVPVAVAETEVGAGQESRLACVLSLFFGCLDLYLFTFRTSSRSHNFIRAWICRQSFSWPGGRQPPVEIEKNIHRSILWLVLSCTLDCLRPRHREHHATRLANVASTCDHHLWLHSSRVFLGQSLYFGGRSLYFVLCFCAQAAAKKTT